MVGKKFEILLRMRSKTTFLSDGRSHVRSMSFSICENSLWVKITPVYSDIT